MSAARNGTPDACFSGMTSFHHVLVATDFSPASTHALHVASEFASRMGARLSVLHVVVPPPYPYPVPPSEGSLAAAEGRLEDDVAALGLPTAVGILREGAPADEIVSAAGEVAADLVVVGSRGRRGAAHTILGSVAEKVVRLSPVPVLTLHPWRFESRAGAGRELAVALAPLRLQAPAVIALSRGALLVAAEIARPHADKPDLVLGLTIRHGDVLLGGACEDGTIRLDTSEAARAAGAPERHAALFAARASLGEEAAALRGARWVGDLWQRTVVLVADELDDAWPILVVRDVVRRHGATRVVVAAPSISNAARAVIEASGIENVLLFSPEPGESATNVYRDERDVSVDEAVKCLRPRPSPAA